jgi:hypothetical protein
MAILADQDKGKSKGEAPGTTKDKKVEPGAAKKLPNNGKPKAALETDTKKK